MQFCKVEYSIPSVARIVLQANKEELEVAAQAAYERTKGNYTVTGYAPGQAPRAAIEQARGSMVFWFDAVNDLLDRDALQLVDEAAARENLDMISDPDFDLLAVDAEQGVTVAADVCLQPVLQLTKTEGFAVKVPVRTVSLQEAEASVQQMAQVGADVSELTAELVREQLQKQADAQAELAAQAQLLDQLADACTGPLPQPMVEQAFEAQMAQLTERLNRMQGNRPDFLKAIGMTEEQMQQQLRYRAEKNLRARFALEYLTIAAGQAPNDEQVREVLAQRAANNGQTVEEFTRRGTFRRVKTSILRDRGREILAQRSEVELVREA